MAQPYGYPPQGGYPPQQGGYPPQQGGYPPPQQQYRPPQYGQPPAPQGYPQPYGQPQYGGQPQYAPQPQYAMPPQPYGQQPYGQQGAFNPPVPTAQTDPERVWFMAVDQDNSGRIDARELQAALSKGGFTFNISVAERVLRMFDKDNSGGLSYIEFKQAHEFIKTMSAGFRARDRDNSGVLEGPEVRAALAASGYQLQEGTFQIMMKKFDREQVGGLRFDDYVALSVTIGTVRNVFAFYDRQRTGQVTFNFDTFFTSVLTCS